MTDKLIEQKVKVDHVNYDTFTESGIFLATEGHQFLKRKTMEGVYR